MSCDPGRIKEQFKALQGERQFIETTWRDCYNYTMPIRGSAFNSQTTGYGQDGNLSDSNNKKTTLYDTTAADAVDQLASFVMAGAVPANARWFDFSVSDDPDLQLPWFDECADIVWRKIHAGNFDASSFDALMDMIIAGMFCQHIDLTPENDLMFDTWQLGSSYFSSSKQGGLIDIIYRNFKLTPLQAVNEYGTDNLPPNICAQACGASKDKPSVDILLAIYPRDCAVGITPDKYPFASVHIHLSSGKLLRESGYMEFPCSVPRWAVMPESVYATGPVYKSLPKIKLANQLYQFILLNAEMAAVGMYKTVDDGVINPSSITIGPRQVIVLSDMSNFEPVGPAGNFNISETMLMQVRTEIKESMMTDQLVIPQNSGTTATEINTRMDLLRQRVAPVFGRMQAEWLQRVVARCFGLLMRAGLLPPIPDELQGKTIHIRYVSPLARSQRMAEVNAIEHNEMMLMQAMQVRPEIGDVYNWDAGARERAYLTGMPAKLLNTEAQVRKIRDERDKQQQAAQAAAQMQGAQ